MRRKVISIANYGYVLECGHIASSPRRNPFPHQTVECYKCGNEERGRTIQQIIAARVAREREYKRRKAGGKQS